MKKSTAIAGTVIFAAVAYTGLAWYVGWEAEKTIRAAVDRANERMVESLGPDLGNLGASINIDDYQRGVFSSQARYTFVMNEGGDRTEFALQDLLQHGPFPWSLLKQGSFTPLLAHSQSQLVDTDTVKRWFDAARGDMPLSADTRIGFGGQGTTEWVFAPLDWALDGDRLSFSGGSVRAEFSNDLRDSKSTGHFESLVVSQGSGDETVSITDIRLDSSSQAAADDQVQMQGSLKAAALVVDDVAMESLRLEELAVVVESTQRGALLDAAMRYDVQRLLVGEIDLGSLSLGGKFGRFDFEAVSALIAEYDAIAAEHGADEGEDFDLTPQDEERLFARLVTALASNPTLALDPVIWRNDKGETTLSVNVDLQAVSDAADKSHEDALADALREARIELALSRPMLLQVVSRVAGGDEELGQFDILAAMMFDAYVERLEQQGLVRREGDRALSSILYQDGSLQVNGRSTTVDELLMQLSALGL